jgi:hypothetical protein
VVRAALSVAFALLLAACADLGPTPPGRSGEPGGTALASASMSEADGGPVPNGFPVIDGSQPASVPASDPGLVARWTTSANGAEVYAFYVDALPAASFKIEQLQPGGAAAVIVFGGQDGSRFELALIPFGDGTKIDLKVAEQSP